MRPQLSQFTSLLGERAAWESDELSEFPQAEQVPPLAAATATPERFRLKVA
jgi:hypothetical protein